MAGDTVWMDVLPALDGFAKALATGTDKAAKTSGKTAGDGWSRAFSQSAGDAGSKAVVAELEVSSQRAQKSVQTATVEIGKARASQREAAARTILAESNYQQAVAKSEAAAGKSAAEQAQAQAKVEAASLRLEAAREKEKIAAGKVEGAEGSLRAAYREAEEAAKQLADAQDLAAKSTAEGGTEAAESAGKWDRVKDAIGGLPGKVSDFGNSLGGLATKAATAIGLSVAFSEGWETALDLSNGTAKVEAALGLSVHQSQVAGETAGQLYADGYGESMGDVNAAIESVMSSLDGMKDASTANLQEVTGQALSFADAFDMDVSEAVTAAAQLINQGLATDATAAFDLMTSSLQQVPAALRGEVMDATNEYSQFFSQLGIDGPEAMGLLVTASEDGQYGIDKMGDALKELTIRSTDMSTASVAAYEAAGLSAEDMSAKFLAGGDTARGAFDELIAGLEGIEDPTKRANAAIGLFGTPLEDLATSDIPAFLDQMSSMDSSLGDVSGKVGDLDDKMSAAIDPVESVKRTMSGLLSDAVKPLVEPLQDVATWFKETPGAATAVMTAIGALVGVWGTWKLATTAWSVATTTATAVQKAFNLAMNANPIGLVVTAIGALVAGLTYFFTKTETGKKIWEKFTTAIGDAWQWVCDKLGQGWDWIQANVFEPIKSGVKAVGDFFGDVWDGIIDAVDSVVKWFSSTAIPAFKKVWDGITTGAEFAWNVVKLIFTAVATGFTLLWRALEAVWSAVGQPIVDHVVAGFTWLKDGAIAAWDLLNAGLKTGWDWLSENVFEPVKTGAQWVAEKFVIMKDGAIAAWELLKTGLKAGWDWIQANVFEPIKSGAQWVWDKFVGVKNGVVNAWDLMRDGLKAGGDWINDKVFSKIKEGVGKVGDAFETAKEAIGKAWDQIKEKTKSPVNFVIETVYNNGVRSAFNTIADKVGLPAKWRLPHVEKVATGGVLPGYTPGVDVHKFYSDTAGILELSGGESIMRPEFTRAVGGPSGVAALNKAAISGTMPIAKYAGGGVLDTLGGWASSAWNWTKDAAETTWNFLSDPVEGFKQLVTGPMNSLLGSIGGSTWGEIAKGIPKFVIGGVVDSAVSAVKNIFNASGGGGDSAAMGGGIAGPMLAGAWALPSRGPITSSYGPRWGSFHAGTDIAGGGPTYAAHAGRVMKAGWNIVAGRTGIGILLDHGGGIQTYYGHNPVGGLRVTPGQLVAPGQRVGAQGATGNVTGTHLHFEVHKGNPNNITNPVPFMAGKGIRLGTYDSGGALEPGLTLAYNGTGKPETIRTFEQESGLNRDIDLSPETIHALAEAIGEELGLVGETVKDVKRTVTMARTIERM